MVRRLVTLWLLSLSIHIENDIMTTELHFIYRLILSYSVDFFNSIIKNSYFYHILPMQKSPTDKPDGPLSGILFTVVWEDIIRFLRAKLPGTPLHSIHQCLHSNTQG